MGSTVRKLKNPTKVTSNGSTFVDGFSVNIGPFFRVTGKLRALRKPNATKAVSYKNLCPSCAVANVANVPKQGYTCDKGHGPFSAGEMAKGRETSKNNYIIVPKDKIEAAKATVESELLPNVLNLSVHNATDVELATWADGSAYAFEPHAGNEIAWQILCDLAGEPDVAFVGTVNLRGYENLVRLVRSADGSLMVQTLIWPEDLADREPIHVDYPSELLDQAMKLIDVARKPFDLDNYRSLSRQAHANLVSDMLDLAPAGPAGPVARPSTDPAAAVMAALEAALAAQAKDPDDHQ